MDSLEALETLDLRVGRILRAEPNPRARKPSYRLWIDFGPLGEKTSSAQLTVRYQTAQLIGRLVVAVNVGAEHRGFSVGAAGARRARCGGSDRPAGSGQ